MIVESILSLQSSILNLPKGPDRPSVYANITQSIFGIDRPDACLLKAPPTLLNEALMQAFTVQYPLLKEVVVFQQGPNRILHFQRGADLAGVLANGLNYEKTNFPVRSLHNTSSGSLIQCTIPLFSSGGLEALQEALSPYGTMVDHHREYYPGLPHPTGKISFLLSLHAEDKLPPKKLVVDRDNGYFLEEIKLNITPIPGKKLCYMCHKIGHRREACPVAPLCSSCGQTTAHGPKRCPLKKRRAPVSQKHKPRSRGPPPQVPVPNSATTQQSP